MKILVVDDDEALRAGVVELLHRQGWDCCTAADADAADTWVRGQSFAAIVLDLGLPGGDGLDLLRQWRRRGLHTPVLIVSARGAPDDRADGIQAGADDYLGKPYHARELVARLQRLLHGARDQSTALRFGEDGRFSFDASSRVVRGPEGDIALSSTLRRVLEILLAAQGRPVSKDHLLDQVSQELEPASPNAVEQWIRRLRARLGEGCIRTEPGLGYRLPRAEE